MKYKQPIRIGTIAFFVTIFLFPQTLLSFAQEEEVAPAPPSIGADIPLTYFGPAPSDIQRELIGPYQLLKSGTVDKEAGTITLPLYQGKVKLEGGNEQNVWHILTDTTDKGNADALGLNYSPKLIYSADGARSAILGQDNTLIFNGGTVDFSLDHQLLAGNTTDKLFPPKIAKAGSIGDKHYSPIVRIENAGGNIYNAPVIASNVTAEQISFCDGTPDYSLVHDKVLSICPKEGTVTLKLTNGFSFARPVLYLSTDASVPIAAAMEEATHAPRLATIKVGGDDSAFSAVERLFAIINGPTGKDNPQRQGFNSALTDGVGGPLNVLGGIPTIATDYSPLWDVNLGEWSQKAIDNGYTSRLIEEFQILGLVQQGWITGPGGGQYGSAGIIVDCPIVFRFL